MQYLEVLEVAKITGISEQYLRTLCRNERVANRKEPVSHGSKKTKYYIDIDDEFFKNYSSEKQSETDTEFIETNYVKETKQTEQNQNTSELITNMLQEIRYYADAAINSERNKTKLLEDSERRKDDRLIELMAENKYLKEKNDLLEKENQQLKQKSFFGIKFNK